MKNNPSVPFFNNARNQLTAIGALVSYRYDENGHIIEKTEPGQVTVYVYDLEERLVEIRQGVDAISATTLATYQYNAYGQRVRKTVGTTTTYYCYNDQGLAGEYDAAGVLQKEYHFTPYGTWMTNPLFQRDVSESGSEVYLYHNDHLGTPQQMIARNGSVVWSADYAAFGGAMVFGSVENNLRFAGQYFDGESGTHYNIFRDYDPVTGRCVQADPLGILLDFADPMRLVADELGFPIPDFDGDMEDLNHSYGYAYQNALIYTDPTGEFVPLLIGVTKAALTGACILNCFGNPGVSAACTTIANKTNSNSNVLKGGLCAAGCAVGVSRASRFASEAYKANASARRVQAAKNAAKKRRPKKPKRRRR